MKARPILFSAEMVRALLDGRKSQTRRAIKPQPLDNHKPVRIWWPGGKAWDGNQFQNVTPPYGRPGDLLYARESFSGPHGFDDAPASPPRLWDSGSSIWYWADGNPEHGDWSRPKPGIHMPRRFSRLTLRLTEVRVERLQDISDDDAIAEGIEYNERLDPVGSCKWRHYGQPHTGIWPPSASYHTLWDSINGAGSADADPWVWALVFETIRKNVDEVLKNG